MAMEWRENSTLTSPYVTPSGRPQWRQSVVGIRRKMKSSQAFPGSSSHLFLILRSFTRTLYYDCFSSPIHFAIVLFLPLHLFNQSCFQVPPVTSWPTASSLVLSFSAISYSGDEPQRMTLQRLGEKKAQRIPAWKYSGRLSRLPHFSSCHS